MVLETSSLHPLPKSHRMICSVRCGEVRLRRLSTLSSVPHPSSGWSASGRASATLRNLSRDTPRGILRDLVARLEELSPKELERAHSSLGYLSPAGFERRFLEDIQEAKLPNRNCPPNRVKTRGSR